MKAAAAQCGLHAGDIEDAAPTGDSHVPDANIPRLTSETAHESTPQNSISDSNPKNNVVFKIAVFCRRIASATAGSQNWGGSDPIVEKYSHNKAKYTSLNKCLFLAQLYPDFMMEILLAGA